MLRYLPQPIHFTHVWSLWRIINNNAITFVSKSSIENNIKENYELKKQLVEVKILEVKYQKIL